MEDRVGLMPTAATAAAASNRLWKSVDDVGLTTDDKSDVEPVAPPPPVVLYIREGLSDRGTAKLEPVEPPPPKTPDEEG